MKNILLFRKANSLLLSCFDLLVSFLSIRTAKQSNAINGNRNAATAGSMQDAQLFFNFKKPAVALAAFAFLFFIGGQSSWGQGSETFTNLPSTSASSYATRSWTGDNGGTWTASAARTDQTLTGKAITWTAASANVLSPTLTGGMGTLTFNYVRAFTGTSARSIEVYVNSVKIGSTITVTATSDVVANYSSSINVSGNVVLEIRCTGSNQVKVDDIAWTAYSAGNPSLAITGTTAYGTICTGVATTKSFTITNTGTAATGVVVSSNNTQFVVGNLSSTSIGATNGTATFDVTYTPTTGAQTPTISSFYSTNTASGTLGLTSTSATAVTQTVTSQAASLIGSTTATLNGIVGALGVCPSTTEKGFVYSLTSANSDPLVSGTGVTKTAVSGLTTGAFTLALTGLTSGAGYSFKSYIFNGTAYTYGATTTFTTTTPPANDNCSGATFINTKCNGTIWNSCKFNAIDSTCSLCFQYIY